MQEYSAEAMAELAERTARYLHAALDGLPVREPRAEPNLDGLVCPSCDAFVDHKPECQAATGNWQTREMGSTEVDSAAIASQDSNRVTLPAGKYRFKATL